MNFVNPKCSATLMGVSDHDCSSSHSFIVRSLISTTIMRYIIILFAIRAKNCLTNHCCEL